MAEHAELLKFLDNSPCLIVDASHASSWTLQTVLLEMGVPSDRVTILRKFEEAKTFIANKKPKLLIADHHLDKNVGLALVEQLEKILESHQRICMVVAHSPTEAAVAEAAEGHVDGYFVKPFSSEAFRSRLGGIVLRKLNPSPYSVKLEEGRKFLSAEQLPGAVKEFMAAKPLDPKPTLACFFAGHTYQKMGDINRALDEFKQGRGFQNIHYKCLVGEFELHIAQKRYKDAYELVELLKANYPLSPKRLGQMFMAAVFNMRFEDVATFFDLFQQLDQRSDELTKIASSALFAAGKHFIEKKEVKKAIEIFQKGFIVSSLDMHYLEKVVGELLKNKSSNEAAEFLMKAPQRAKGTLQFNVLSLRVDFTTQKREEAVERARKTLLENKLPPDIIEQMVKFMAESDKATLAEGVITRAAHYYPEIRAKLYKILEETKPKKSA